MTSPRRLTVINGPNLGILGVREPDVYGKTTEQELVELIRGKVTGHSLELEFFQSDVEGEIVSAIRRAAEDSIGLVINPAAYSHYSIAIMDAMKAFPGPVVEVHISQVFAREPMRRQLLTARSADAVVTGAGLRSYTHGVDLVMEMYRDRQH